MRKKERERILFPFRPSFVFSLFLFSNHSNSDKRRRTTITSTLATVKDTVFESRFFTSPEFGSGERHVYARLIEVATLNSLENLFAISDVSRTEIERERERERDAIKPDVTCRNGWKGGKGSIIGVVRYESRALVPLGELVTIIRIAG